MVVLKELALYADTFRGKRQRCLDRDQAVSPLNNNNNKPRVKPLLFFAGCEEQGICASSLPQRWLEGAKRCRRESTLLFSQGSREMRRREEGGVRTSMEKGHHHLTTARFCRRLDSRNVVRE